MKILATIGAVVCIVSAFFGYMNAMMIGFPDSFITPYGRETEILQRILVKSCFGFGLLLLAFSFSRKLRLFVRLQFGLLCFAGLILCASWLVPACPSLKICQDAYFALTDRIIDDGTGG